MNEKYFKVFLWIFIGIVLWAIFFGGEKEGNYNVNITSQAQASEGLDLQAVGALVQKAKNAEQLEKLLNDPGEGVNNLDLNEDGKADYIKVEEYGEGKSRGFSLTTEPSKGEEQEIATIDVESVNDKEAEVEVRGNEQIYGHGHSYHSRYSFTDMLLLSYLFSPHRYYMSPWGWGAYPGYYRPYGVVGVSSYRTRVASSNYSSNMTSGKNNAIKSRAKSPNAGKSASSVKAPLRNPTASQKSFQKRNPSKTVRKGGFGRSTTRKASVRSSGSRRSGGSWGGK